MATKFKNIKCGIVNPTSVNNKTEEIRQHILEKKLDLFCITETWLKPIIDDANIKAMVPESYTMVNNMRDSLNRGGGVV